MKASDVEFECERSEHAVKCLELANEEATHNINQPLDIVLLEEEGKHRQLRVHITNELKQLAEMLVEFHTLRLWNIASLWRICTETQRMFATTPYPRTYYGCTWHVLHYAIFEYSAALSAFLPARDEAAWLAAWH